MKYRQKKTGILAISVVLFVGVFNLAACGIALSGDESTIYGDEETITSTEQSDTETIADEETKLALNIQDYYTINTGDPSNLYFIDEENVLWGCGRNDYGQLGQGTQDFDFHEDMVKIAENVIHVDYSQRGFTIFLTEDYKLYGMGTAATGALQEYADITLEMSVNEDKYIVSTPKLLLEDVVYARCGNGDIACLMEDGSVWTWGTVWREGMECYFISEPKKILDEAVLITGGWHNHAALLEDGSVWTWGYNYAGNCGIEGEVVISDPVKVAEDAIMVWTGRTKYNVDCYDISEFDGVYERYLENTIILKRDGTYWACGIGLGEEEKLLPRYWEVSDYSVVCTSEFVQIQNEEDF